ncbi:MAG: hypothetical protein RIR12_2296, partial [Bacteroidota bacterium]
MKRYFFFLLFFTLTSSFVYSQLIISEFRLRGPNGANDEFIEVYNNSGADHVVAGGGTGYAIAASDGVTRFVIPNGTIIPSRGYYLGVNSVGYNLASYPAGNGSTATGDATYTTDITDNAGIALFNTSVAGNFTLANRMDAVGSTSEANTLYKEGAGYPALVAFSIDYCWRRSTYTGTVQDSNNNAADLEFNDTNGTSAGGGQRLGAPGPQNSSSPIARNAGLIVTPLDPCVSEFSPPNRVRDFTSDPPNNSTFGTWEFRYTITNNTGVSITRLRFRIDSLRTFPAPSGFADLRPRTSTAIVVTVDRTPCGSGTSNVTVNGTMLEQPPSQPNGGGYNSSMSAGVITLGSPLANGSSVDIRLLFGVQQDGNFAIKFSPEVLPIGAATGPAADPVLITFTPPCTAPTITCPANITTNNDPGFCNKIVNYAVTSSGTPSPTFTYTLSGATIGSGSGNGSGATYNVGVTTVNVTATNSCGSATCSFTVTVNDTQAPTITCPAAVTVSCAALVPAVNTAAVVATDNCSGTVTVTHVGDVISNQTCANRYTLTRTYRATDAAGNASTCTQIITVNDTQAPTITCPAAVTVSCAALVPAVNIAAVVATDNCSGTVT